MRRDEISWRIIGILAAITIPSIYSQIRVYDGFRISEACTAELSANGRGGGVKSSRSWGVNTSIGAGNLNYYIARNKSPFYTDSKNNKPHSLEESTSLQATESNKDHLVVDVRE